MNKILINFLLLGLVANAWAGPVFDPFLEGFQVGAYRDTDELDMVGVWPGGLLTPVQVDTVWVAAARDLLGNPQDHPNALTHRFLGLLGSNPLGTVPEMAEVLRTMDDSGSGGLPGFNRSEFLLTERWALGISNLVQKGDLSGAKELLAWGLENPELGLRDRERFVWQLRDRQLEGILGRGLRPLERPWSPETSLGPYDRSCVWALWTAHRKAAKMTLLPASLQGKQEAQRLAGLRDPGLSAADLEGSSFARELKAGLGATWFEGEELKTHLARYPDPPSGLSAQGWWVKGQRFLKRGQAGHYRALARRPDLLGDWRLDIWRRTSELHLLGGRWDQGLAALDQALELARAGEGTTSLRRLLRHWVEQAAVLALAQGKADTAWSLLDRGDATFTGEALAVFKKETRHWRRLRGLTIPPEEGVLGRAREMVEAGQAADAVACPGADHPRKHMLVQAASRSLWPLWVRWGRALSQVDGLKGEVAERAAAYDRFLAAAEGLTGPELEKAALSAVAARLEGRPEILVPFLDKIVDRDVGKLCGWASVPEPSPVPGLLPLLRGSQLDMHAALGLALATGDMRGILGLAFELPAQGLTRDEKRLFLFPLPGEGPIRQALLAADSDPALILAVARNESLFEPAVRSRAGALGYMQIMPFHFRSRGALPGTEHWGIPAVSIGKGDRLLEEARRRYANDPYRQLAAYNAGPGATDRWNKQLGGVPDRDIFLAWIGYTETRNYVEKVLIDREIYDWLLKERSRP